MVSKRHISRWIVKLSLKSWKIHQNKHHQEYHDKNFRNHTGQSRSNRRFEQINKCAIQVQLSVKRNRKINQTNL